jgi:2,4-dienoyl-CoA reductase-like NADH-dependent reductase (Old Yellow Enzyme family)
MIKLGCHDYLDGESELTAEESAGVASALEKEGICHIEVSHGYLSKSHGKLMLGITSPEKEAPLLPDVPVIREATSGPLALVAGMRSLAVMEEIVNSGTVDHISLCRPFIREPGLIKRWKNGSKNPAECISCGGCFNPGPDGNLAISCRQLKKK